MGLERTAPSFRSFIKHIPPPDREKPLPPPPVRDRRSSDSAAGSASERSSSVYSRIGSEYDSDLPYRENTNFANTPFFLQPAACNMSTPLLREKPPATIPLGARAFTPGPIHGWDDNSKFDNSRNDNSGPKVQLSPVDTRTFGILSSPSTSPTMALNCHLRTVSLEEANQRVRAPGAVHLLPEELRAQSAKRSGSQAGFSSSSTTYADERLPSQDLHRPPPHLTCSNTTDGSNYGNAQFRQGEHHHEVEGAVQRKKPRLTEQQRLLSKAKSSQALGLGNMEDFRYRTYHGVPRATHSAHHNVSKVESCEDLLTWAENGEDDGHTIVEEYHAMLSQHHQELSEHLSEQEDEGAHSRMITEEYHAMLSQHHRQPAKFARNEGPYFDHNVMSDTKLVPRPLLYHKSPPMPPQRANGHETERIPSFPFDLQRISDSERYPRVADQQRGLQTWGSPTSEYSRTGTTSISMPGPTSPHSANQNFYTSTTGKAEDNKIGPHKALYHHLVQAPEGHTCTHTTHAAKPYPTWRWRRPSLVDHVMDDWEEKKHDKRRNDLKKMIKVVSDKWPGQ